MSPCISVCSLDALGYCAGCLRTRDEIAGWLRMSAREQWTLLDVLDARRSALDGGPG
jgi:hypothetical protein